jgi:hypothetical protein
MSISDARGKGVFWSSLEELLPIFSQDGHMAFWDGWGEEGGTGVISTQP